MATTNCGEFGTAVSRLQTTNYDKPTRIEDFIFLPTTMSNCF